MTTKNKNKGQIANPDELITALYCCLSVEDMKDHDKKKGEIDESNSITNQKQIYLIMPKNTVTRIPCSSWMMDFGNSI